MTHAQLLREMALGEMAYWLAKAEIDNEQYEHARKEATRTAAQK